MCLWRKLVVWLFATVLIIACPRAERALITTSEAHMRRPSCKRPIETVASWYGVAFEGRRMASGRMFQRRRLSAASDRLPLGTWVRVIRPGTGHSVLLQIEDRGPYHRGRGIDLSEAAAERLGMRQRGIARVVVEIVPSCFIPLPH